MRNPRPKKFTAEQERAMEAAERPFCRAQILRSGVAANIKTEFAGSFDLDVAIQVLQEAKNDEQEAFSSEPKPTAGPTKTPSDSHFPAVYPCRVRAPHNRKRAGATTTSCAFDNSWISGLDSKSASRIAPTS